VKPPILGDNTFKDVPVGIDPSTWPLDVNIQYTQDLAKSQGGVYPNGQFKVYGDFCWGGGRIAQRSTSCRRISRCPWRSRARIWSKPNARSSS